MLRPLKRGLFKFILFLEMKKTGKNSKINKNIKITLAPPEKNRRVCFRCGAPSPDENVAMVKTRLVAYDMARNARWGSSWGACDTISLIIGLICGNTS